MKYSIKTAALSAIAVAGLATGMLASTDATAIEGYNSTGGTACKGASGFGAQLFYFSNLYVQNTSANPQYISCDFQDFGAEPGSPQANAFAMNIGFANPTAASITFNCVVQSGQDGYSTTNSASFAKAVPANNTFTAQYLNSGSTPAIPERPNQFAAYTLSCLVPSQGKVSMINIFQPSAP